MLTEEFVNLISTICAQYSYVSRSKQYIDKDKNHFTLETATSDIISKLATDHSDQYTKFAKDGKLIKETIIDKLAEATKKKKAKQTTRVAANSKASTYSTGLDSKLVDNPLWKPNRPFNEIDSLWCAGLVLDNNSILYRRKENGAYEIIGSASGRGIDSVASNLSRTQTIPDVFEYVKNQLDIMSTFACKSQEFEQEGPTALLAQHVKITDDEGNETEITLKEFLDVTDDNIPTSNDNVISLLVYKFLNSRLPASIFFGYVSLLKYYNIFRGEDDKELQVFQGFVARVKDASAPTSMGYFKNVLDHYQEKLGHIDNRPVAVSKDGSEPAFGVFDQKQWDEDAAKYAGFSYKDSYLVKTYLEPMDKDQIKFVCAWLYAMFFCRGAVISVVHQDNGGSLKTTVKQILRKMVKIYYGADITFVLKLDQLNREQYRYDAKRMLSIADALFIDYDEPPTKGEFWENVKAMTGGMKVDINIKELYSNPYTLSGSPLFYFGSNKPIYLQDKGAFKRRLACIITTANDTWKKIPRDMMDKLNNDTETQKREFHLLMRLGEIAYKEITEKYGTLSEASVRLPSIASQLDAQSPWDEYLESFYQSLFEPNQEFVRIANNAIDTRLEAYKAKNRTSLKIDHLSVVQYFKSVHPDNTTKLFKIKNTVTRGWVLHRVDIDDTGAEECTFDAIGLDEDGDPIQNSPHFQDSNKFLKQLDQYTPNDYSEVI